MPTAFRFTSKDLELMPRFEGVRYEIIDGEMYVSTAPHWHHQFAGGSIVYALQCWDLDENRGIPISAPGLVLADDQDVIPDVIWISRERLARGQDAAGHFTIAPELVVEVLSLGSANERRDREIKLSLYSRRGVDEYWIVDWRAQTVEVHRRRESALELVGTLSNDDTLTSPLLPDFSCPIASLWAPTAS